MLYQLRTHEDMDECEHQPRFSFVLLNFSVHYELIASNILFHSPPIHFGWGDFQWQVFFFFDFLISYWKCGSVFYEMTDLSKWDHSPWSVNSISVKTQRLNICFHLSLEENQFRVDLSVFLSNVIN